MTTKTGIDPPCHRSKHCFSLSAALALALSPVGHGADDHEEILALYQLITAVEASDIDSYVGGLHPTSACGRPAYPALTVEKTIENFLARSLPRRATRSQRRAAQHYHDG